MKLVFGLRMARGLFKKLGWRRKRMTCAYISKGTIIISENIFKSHPDSRARANRIHCEHAVLRYVSDGSYGEIFTYRENSTGGLAMARPCVDCLTLIKSKGVRRITYTIENGFASETV